MLIKDIHTFLVNPGKGEEVSLISGTELKLRTGKLYKLLENIFSNAPAECEHEIIFTPKEEGSQHNDCKDLLTKYVKKRSYDNGEQIATHLQKVTTRRSGQGLLFLIYGENKTSKRLVVSRFPADNGIVAEEGRVLNVEFVEKIFMKNSKAYKSVVYEGESTESHFWEGKAIDKQINSDITISDYWIKDFLLSDFSLTPIRGTSRVAVAIKKLINTTPEIDIKEELSSGVKLSRSINNKAVTAKSFFKSLNLSNETIDLLLKEIDPALHDEKFRFSVDELYRHISFKSVELDNGAYLSAPTEKFDQVFEIVKKKTQNVSSFSTSGKIIDERFKKAR